jgi:hemerythrin
MIWDVSYKIGVKQIDKQHQEFFNILLKLENSLKRGTVTEHTGIAIKNLVDYTKTHLKDEETFMKLINYPDIENHKIAHQGLINKVKEILNVLKTGEKFTTSNLIQILQDWIIKHILTEDIKLHKFYSDYLDQNNKTESNDEEIEIVIL